MKVNFPVSREDNCKTMNLGGFCIKNLLCKKHCTGYANIYTDAWIYSKYSKMLKVWPSDQYWGANCEKGSNQARKK